MRRIALALVVASVGAAGTFAHAQSQSTTAMTIIQWRDAVLKHVPGQADEAVLSVERLTLDDRRAMSANVAAFLRSLVKSHDSGMNAFLERAAVLHGDAAMLGFTGAVVLHALADTLPPTRARAPASPFSYDGRFTVENDGEVVGAIPADWNWVFARSLLDLRAPKHADDAFVGAWYHATASFMFKTRSLAEASGHLERAAVLLPDDARILFDRACYFESHGLPRAQQLLNATAFLVLPVERANGQAEAFFRRALVRDPGLYEARVRLARLLVLRSQFAEALAIIRAASPGSEPKDAILAFYAHLFSGRAERGLGHLDAAADHAHQALNLFPDAQSALMASSQIAMLRADAAAAEEPLRRLAELTANADERFDPWWIYDLFTGRETKALLTAMWAQAPGALRNAGMLP